MKKTLLALAIAATATSANAVEIFKSEEATVDFYGQLRTELRFLDDSDYEASLSSGSSRAGVNVNYNATDSLDVFGKIEFSIRYYEDKDDGKNDMFTRLHYVGVKGDFGSVRIGKDWTPGEHIYGADYSYFFGGSALFYSVLNGAAHDSQIQYVYDADDFFVRAAYGLPEDDTNQEMAELYAGMFLGDLSFNVGGGIITDAYSYGVEVEQTYIQGTVEYTMDNLTLGATLGTTTLENTATGADTSSNGLSLAAMYGIAPKTTLYGGYEFVEHDLDLLDESNVFYAGVEYKFSRWARIYAEYAYRDGSTLGFVNNTNDKIGAGDSADKFNDFAFGARVYW